MIVQIDSPKVLSDAIAIMSELVTEVRIKLTEEGMSIVAVDPANVALVVFKIPKESFSKYEAGNEVWGINLDDFKRILKRAASAGSMTFEQDENQLKISVFDKAKRNFVLSLIDVESEDKKEPNLEFSTEVEMEASEFAQSVEDCSVVADSCSLETKDDAFFIEAKGSLNSAQAEFSSDHVQISGKSKSRYSLEYLMKFSKAKSIAKKVKLHFSENHPLKINFAGERMGMAFILAPRVETD